MLQQSGHLRPSSLNPLSHVLGHASQELQEEVQAAIANGEVFDLKSWLLSKNCMCSKVKELLRSGQHEAARDLLCHLIQAVDK